MWSVCNNEGDRGEMNKTEMMNGKRFGGETKTTEI